MNRMKRTLVVLACAVGLSSAAGAGEPLSLGAILGPRSDAILMNTVPAAIDMARRACEVTAKACGVSAVKVADLPEALRRDLEAVYPKGVLDDAALYFDVPLNDPSMGIGFLNTLGMIASGGGTVMGMTFGNDIYLAFTFESLDKSAENREVVAHELIHVAQYQGLGYSEYKQLYAKETVRGQGAYEDNALEKEAFRFQGCIHKPGARAYFAFYATPDVQERAQITTLGTPKLVPMDDLLDQLTEPIDMTATDDDLPRKASLALGGITEYAFGTIVPQILDPHGDAPLFMFRVGSDEPSKLLLNAPVTKDGPHIVALSATNGVEIMWRTPDDFHSQRFAAGTLVEDQDQDGTLEVIEPKSGAATPSVWRWSGNDFTPRR